MQLVCMQLVYRSVRQAHPVSHTCGYEFIAVCWLGCCLEVIASWLDKCLYDYVAIMCLICTIAYRALMQIGDIM